MARLPSLKINHRQSATFELAGATERIHDLRGAVAGQFAGSNGRCSRRDLAESRPHAGDQGPDTLREQVRATRGVAQKRSDPLSQAMDGRIE
jgi:hypothetical protein